MTRLIMVDNISLYIDGYTKILHYTNADILILCKKKTLCIHGRTMYIDRYDNESMLIKGDIQAVSWR